jgi:hypothetical protein
MNNIIWGEIANSIEMCIKGSPGLDKGGYIQRSHDSFDPSRKHLNFCQGLSICVVFGKQDGEVGSASGDMRFLGCMDEAGENSPGNQ